MPWELPAILQPSGSLFGHQLAFMNGRNACKPMKNSIQEGRSGNSYRFGMVNSLRFPAPRLPEDDDGSRPEGGCRKLTCVRPHWLAAMAILGLVTTGCADQTVCAARRWPRWTQR